MATHDQTFEVDRVPTLVSFEETSAFTETYGFSGVSGRIFLEGQRIVPRGRESDTVLVFMHPASTLNLLPFPVALARAGYHVMCCGSRYAKNDTALIMEKVVADLGAYVRHARDRLGYRRVVLVGWSGGGSLALFYQSQAEHATVRHTPAGDPCDLSAVELPPVDGVSFIAAHTGRARILAEWIDPSVTDESDPDLRNRGLDLYDPGCDEQPPYSPQFVAAFRAAQLARVRRITAWARATLERLRSEGGKEVERPFVVHRTMADPRFLDPALEPNGRPPRWCYLGEPETVNSGPAGLARFTTLRAWLSQWSYDDSVADAVNAAPGTNVPLLIMENGADDAVPTSHVAAVRAAARPERVSFARIEGAGHYYKDQPEHLAAAIARFTTWLDGNALI